MLNAIIYDEVLYTLVVAVTSNDPVDYQVIHFFRFLFHQFNSLFLTEWSLFFKRRKGG